MKNKTQFINGRSTPFLADYANWLFRWIFIGILSVSSNENHCYTAHSQSIRQSMMKKLAFLIVGMAILNFPLGAMADQGSPVGLWKSYDDAGVNQKGLIRIKEVNGVYVGQIEKLILKPNEDQNPLCDKCKDARKDKPVTGMVIINNLKKENDEYSGGEILDPENGETYKCTLRLIDNGKKLKVRGYIGVPILGRSQVWVRAE